MKDKNKSPYRALLLLPVLVVINILMFWVCVYLDTKVFPDSTAMGHPAPILTLLFVVVMPVVDIVFAVVCIIITAVRLSRNRT